MEYLEIDSETVLLLQCLYSVVVVPSCNGLCKFEWQCYVCSVCVVMDNKISINNSGTSTLQSLGLSHDLNYWISD